MHLLVELDGLPGWVAVLTLYVGSCGCAVKEVLVF
jgi:hypothetical protein